MDYCNPRDESVHRIISTYLPEQYLLDTTKSLNKQYLKYEVKLLYRLVVCKIIKGNKVRLDGWHVARRIHLLLREHDDTCGKPHSRMVDIDLVW